MRSSSNAGGNNTPPTGDDAARKQLSSTAQLLDGLVKVEVRDDNLNTSIAISDTRIYLIDSAGSQILTNSKNNHSPTTDMTSSDDLNGSFTSGDGLFHSSLFVMIPPTPIPLQNQPLARYLTNTDNLSQSFHDIYKVQKKHPKQKDSPSVYFLKQNKIDPVDPYVYQLEAIHFAYFRLITPIDGHHSPACVKAVYNEKTEYVGVISKAIPDFKSTCDDPLQESDLPIETLKHAAIEELDKVDRRARLENMELKNKPDSKEISLIVTRTTSGTKRIPVTAKDLRNFRIVKGLAIGLTASYLLEEDDNHKGNMDKEGRRIDGDMLGWPIVSQYKKGGLLDSQLRDPTNRFKLTCADIESFPILNDAAPFYWPTKPALNVYETFTGIMDTFNSIFTRNAYNCKDNDIYKKLANHPVFIYYKFKTLLKYVLTTGQMYRNIGSLHMLEEYQQGNKILIDVLAEHQAERIAICKLELLKSPGFQQFIQKSGDNVIKQILIEFAEYNFTFAHKIEKMPRYQLQVINLEDIITTYVDICAKLRIVKNPDSLKTDSTIAGLLDENQESLRNSFK